MVLTADATSPADFITPVADWFKAGHRTGKCVPVACRSCNTITHVTLASAAEAAPCYACQRRAARAQRSLTERHPVLLSVWGIVALVIAATLAAALDFESTWVVIVMWCAVIFSPFILHAGWRLARRLTSGQRSRLRLSK